MDIQNGNRPDLDPIHTLPRATLDRRARLEYWGKSLAQRIRNQDINQSEFASRCALHTRNGKFGRDLVSNYCRGAHELTPLHKLAMSKVLGITVEELMEPLYGPSPLRGDKKSAPICLEYIDADRAHLHIDQDMPIGLAVRILGLLKGEERDARERLSPNS